MQKVEPVSYLIDFDSTFISTEGLDELAEVSLQGNPQKKEIINQIKSLTGQGMEGSMPFAQSLRERVELLQSNKSHIKVVGKNLKKKISVSITKNKKFFMENADNIYIISGGFKELILPVVKIFGIHPHHVYANNFTYDANGNINGIDLHNPMSKNGGKVSVVKSLKLTNDLYIIGDGYTDYELKKLGVAKKFIAFTENITRESVVSKADEVAHSFDEFLFENKLPRSLSYPKNRISVLLLTNIPNEDLQQFIAEGYAITDGLTIDNNADVQKKINTASIICIGSNYTMFFTSKTSMHRTLAIAIYSDKKIACTNFSQKGIAVFYKNTLATKIINFINAGNTHRSLSIPNLNLPQHKNVHRLLHIHKNVKGILAQINNVLFKHDINIVSQYLKTDNTIGYVIIDVDKRYDKKVLAALKKIPQTIRFRVLY